MRRETVPAKFDVRLWQVKSDADLYNMFRFFYANQEDEENEEHAETTSIVFFCYCMSSSRTSIEIIACHQI